MLRCVLRAILIVLSTRQFVIGADVEGTIVIKHRLTKKKVTANAGAYDRGVAVRVDSDAPQDPLVFERTHVVIYVDGERGSQTVAPVTIEQKNRRFVPDLVVVPEGATVSFPNLDPIFHNVFSLSKPKNFDLGNYPKGQTRSVTFSRPGVVLVNCRLHTNMAAAILVTPNQWNARADGTGRFVLKNVAQGTQTIVAWHKSAGFFKKTVVVGPNGVPGLSFDIPLDENGMIPMQPVAQR